MKKVLFVILFGLAAIALTSVYLVSCSGGGGGGTTSSPVALYATDDMSNFQQVIATVNKVQIVNTGTGASCDVLTTPVTLDIVNLSSVMQLLDIADCPAGPYNRIHIEFQKSVTVTGGTPPFTNSACTFVSYKDDEGHVNNLQCSGNTCTLDITGAVNALVNQKNKVALDFNLHEFEISNPTSTTACTVTMEVSPLNAADMEKLDHEEAITGLVSNISTTAETFTLTRGPLSFNVDYSAVTQPTINDLLQFALDNNLKVKVFSSSIDLDTNTIKASAVYVKIDGAVSALDTTNRTFVLNFQTSKTITIDYTNAVIDGVLSNGATVEVKLNGYDSISNVGFAYKVEVREPEMSMDD